MATELDGDGGGPQTVPAACDQPGPLDPIARRVSAAGEFAELTLFRSILGWYSEQQLRYGNLHPPEVGLRSFCTSLNKG